MLHLHLVVSGRVQMVRFRVFARDIAKRLGLIGSVQNTVDGQVVIEAWGEKVVLEEFIRHIGRGPTLARVDKLVEVWDNKVYENPEPGFSIIH